MRKWGEETVLNEIVKCDLCKSIAEYDCMTKWNDSWAYLCSKCFKAFGLKTGIGYGQKIKYNMKGDNTNEKL